MSIPPTSPCRGCASSFAQPVSEQDVAAAQNLVDNVQQVNCVQRRPPLAEIVYRIGNHDSDVTRRLFRWDRRPYGEALENGFRAIPEEGTSMTTRYDLHDYVHNAGAPLSTNRPRRHVFVSTTLNTDWRPQPDLDTLPGGRTIQVYRYEIYAPGGIWVAATLAGQYRYNSQDEVCFVDGIAPQYIRSAQLFRIERPAYDTRSQRVPFATCRRADYTIVINRHFNPLSDPYMELLIQMPVFYYLDENRRHRFLRHETYPPDNRRKKREVSDQGKWEDALKWYGEDVEKVPSYINAAFRSSGTNDAYLFIKNEYVLVNYAPHSTGDKIVNGPLLICDDQGFPSLSGTPFGEYGIDCAFDTDRNEAFIFCTNLCAYIDYAPGTTDDKILSGPMTIAAMFPFFKGTMFESGIDAAFRSTKTKEAYLFREDKYALINYNSKNLIHIKNISDGFRCLLGTVFANGVDAAFASHVRDEAYLFKGEYYALINFAPHSSGDYMIDGRVKPILDNWPSLRSILPHKNGGLDMHHPPVDA